MSDFMSSDGKSHESAGARNAHQDNLNDQATFEKGLVKGGGILSKIILAVPAVIAIITTFLFGLLFAVGIVGRIIQSIIVGLICGFVMMYIGLTVHFPGALMVLSVIAASGLPALWYYFSHYFTMWVQSTDNGENDGDFASALVAGIVFVTVIAPSFAFLFFGGLIAYIVKSKSATMGIVIFVVAVVGAIAYYVFQSLKVRKDAEEAKEKDKDKRPRMVTLVCAAVSVALACIIPLSTTANYNAVNAKYAKEQKARTELTQATFPAGIIFIDNSYAYTGLTSVTIPEGVTDIGTEAFEGCKNLTSVTLPRSLERIGRNAFAGCTSLVDVIIPSGHTIKYGNYSSGSAGGFSPVESLRAYTQYYYFNEKDNEFARSFRGCTSLSAASQQAIKDSGYKSEF